MKYKVVIEAGGVKYIIFETDNEEEAYELYRTYDRRGGYYIDYNGFEWDLYIEEE